MPDSINTPKPKSNEVSDKSTNLDSVATTPKAADTAEPTAIKDTRVDAAPDNNTPEPNTSVSSDESTDLEIFIAALEANKFKAITDKSVDSVQDKPTPKRDVSDDNAVSAKETDLAIDTTTPKVDKSKVITDVPVDSVQDNPTPEQDTSVVDDKAIVDKKADLAIDAATSKTAESTKLNAMTDEYPAFTPKAEAPAPVHVTSGSSLTPKGRLIKTSKSVANGSRAFIWYLLALVVLVVDQWTKWLAETNLTFNEPVSVIEPFLNWTLAYNYGAAFSFLADAGGWQKWFFSGLALVMALFLTIYLAKAPRQAKLLAVGLALVLGGAVGNLIDRLLHGHVIDFIHVHYADVWNYPIFNIADMGICIGVAIIIIDMIFLENKRNS